MAEPNWTNQTIWTGDNLAIMRGMNSASVDLIYLDPPFNSNRDYAAPVGSQAAGAAFKDTWTLNDVDLAWHGEIAEAQPALYAIIDATGLAHGKGMKSYLIMMAVRLLEMRRLLKDTGSLYLHCDSTAAHYLKLLLDGIFGPDLFRNEIVWRTAGAKGLSSRRFAQNHDTLLRFAASEKARHNPVYTAYDPEYIRKHYRHVDADGRRYRLDNLANPNKDRPNLTYEFLGVTRVWRWTRERMEVAYREGRIHQSGEGRVPALKRYLDEQKGVQVGSVWTDITTLQGSSKEKTGYPTQKPLALLERIIQAGSNEGDMVLDPFCGCATACIAAERLGRKWVGIDLSPKAAELVRWRLQRDIGLLYDGVHRTDIPRRTDLGLVPRYNVKDNKQLLFGRQEGHCNGCGMYFPYRNLTFDHVVPRSQGGSDHIDNLQLLCGACNSMKGSGTQAELLARLVKQGIVRGN